MSRIGVTLLSLVVVAVFVQPRAVHCQGGGSGAESAETSIARLVDGSEIEYVRVIVHGDYVQFQLPSGAWQAFSLGDVDTTTLPGPEPTPTVIGLRPSLGGGRSLSGGPDGERGDHTGVAGEHHIRMIATPTANPEEAGASEKAGPDIESTEDELTQFARRNHITPGEARRIKQEHGLE